MPVASPLLRPLPTCFLVAINNNGSIAIITVSHQSRFDCIEWIVRVRGEWGIGGSGEWCLWAVWGITFTVQLQSTFESSSTSVSIAALWFVYC